MMLLNLNVFSNVASPDPARCLVPDAVRSVRAGLGLGDFAGLLVRVFVDPNPNPGAFSTWERAIVDGLPGERVEVVPSRGLADGFLRSLAMTEGEVALQWEHDFVLLPGRITHTASDIAHHMKRLSINHLRFNKRMNRVAGYDHVMRPAGDAAFPVCRVNGRSNNPQMIEVAWYREMAAPWIDPASPRAEGLEGRLCLRLGGGHVYGPLGKRPAIAHLDGRGVTWQGRLALAFWRARRARPARAG